MDMKKFTQEHPASRFGEAYPVGNGHMGAVVYGSFPVERLVLTENTFYSGRRSSGNNQPGAKEAFYRMRELLKAGDYKAAHKEAERFHGIRNDYGTNLPVGDLTISFGEQKKPVEYERSLDYGKGIAQTYCRTQDMQLCTETFASHPGHALVWHMESSRPADLSVKFCPYHENGSVSPQKAGFLYMVRARESVHCSRPCGVDLYGRCEAVTDGSTSASDEGLTVRGATKLTLYLVCRTDYVEKMAAGDKAAEAAFSDEAEEFADKVWHELKDRGEELRRNTYEEIKLLHSTDVSRLMSRAELFLEGEKAQEAAHLFQYGRYLLLSSSREDSTLPAHLQGIWNDDVACRIGWSCDMHLDINTQMNYWPVDVTNLPEVLPPVIRWLKRLAKEGEQAARESYGLEGWSAELVSNAWCYSAPYWSTAISPYPTGGAWLLSQLWEHCAYTQDEVLLREHVYPLMEGGARFFAGYVFPEGSGERVSCGPSISAENSFVSQGGVYHASNGCTYEVTVIRELFQSFLEISAHLLGGGKTAVDGELVAKVAGLLGKLPDFRILGDGTLAEWAHDFPAADLQHRHTSHLIGLFPFAQITPEKTPELARAAGETIRAKLTPYEQWEDTGWARSLLLFYEARLGDGEAAWFHVKSMLEELQEPNGMIYHPPTRGTLFDDDFGHVYELDGNTGLTAGIAEMLLQSHNGVLQLLPAVPAEWHSGHVKGLMARGGIAVEITWQEGRIVRFVLSSEWEQRCTVRFNKERADVCLGKERPYIWEG